MTGQGEKGIIWLVKWVKKTVFCVIMSLASDPDTSAR